MPPPKRPIRPRRELPPPKKPPYALMGILGVVAIGVVIALVLFLKGGNGKPVEGPAPVEAAPAKTAPRVSVKIFHQDYGRSRVLTLLLLGTGSKDKPERFKIISGSGKEYPASPADAAQRFLPELQRNPGVLAVSFSVPGQEESLDLRDPEGHLHPVYRKPGPDRIHAASETFTFPYEGWRLNAVRKKMEGDAHDLFIKASREKTDAPELDLPLLFLLTDEGKVIPPKIVSNTPLRLRYDPVPGTARELSLQIAPRAATPEYLVFPLVEGAGPLAAAEEPPPAAAEPAPAGAKPEAPPEKKDDLKAEFEKRKSDLFAALKYLEDKPGAEAHPIALEAVAQAISEDLAAGIKAFEEKKAAEVETRFARAALLAAPYSPELSAQLVRMLLLLKQPRKKPLDCATCGGAGGVACDGCQEGFALGACPRCEAKGHVACLLCDGTGQLAHYGYRGKLVINLKNSIKFKFQGKNATMPPQTVTWDMAACAGRGSFALNAESLVHATKAKGSESVTQTCGKFWDQMKNYVFNGRASIQISDKKGSLAPYSSFSARRFFGDYEKCSGGHVGCDRCDGKKNTPCTVCAGTGKAKGLCATCSGVGLRPCATCKGYGDASWVARVLPPGEASVLVPQLAERAGALRAWLDSQALSSIHRSQVELQLADARKGLDPKAQVTENAVVISCSVCKGRGTGCGDCWAEGKREYIEGTPQFEPYALVQKLERQLKSAEKPPEAPSFPPISLTGSAPIAAQGNGEMIAPKVFKREAVPTKVEDMIKRADELYASGLAHMMKGKEAPNPAEWIEETHLAIQDLQNARTIYATAIETLDAQGLENPPDLGKKFRLCMQALVMARKQMP